MNVPLPPDLERLVSEQVASGKYASPGEVVRASLRLLLEREERIASRRLALEEALAVGTSELDRGDAVEADALFDELEAMLRDAEQGRGDVAGETA